MLIAQDAADDGSDDADLNFLLSEDGSQLTVQLLAESPDATGQNNTKTPPVLHAEWVLRSDQFGPDARFVLSDNSRGDNLRYALRVQRARFGRMVRRTCLFTFERRRLRQPKGPEGRSPLRFGLWMAPGIFSRSTAPSQDAGVFMEAFGEAAFDTSTGAPRLLPLRDFLAGEPLKQVVWAQRVAASMQVIFNGHWRVQNQDKRRNVSVTVGADMQFEIDSDWSRARKPFVMHPGLGLKRTKFFWARGSADKVFGDAVETERGEAETEDQLGFWGEGELDAVSDPITFARDRGPALTVSADPGEPTTKCYLRIDVPAKQTALSEVAIPGLWNMDLDGDSRSAATGFKKLRGRLLERAYGPAGASDENILGQAGSLSFDADFEDTRMRVIETPIGRVRLRGRQQDGASSPEPVEPSLQELAFGPRRGQAISVLLSWGKRGGTIAKPRLEWVEVNALLSELEQAVNGADFSRLSFEPADLRLFYHRAPLPYPVLNSAIRLGAKKGSARAHIDLSRARLKAQRSHDLLSLHFEFSDMALVWGDGAPQLRSLNPSCRIGAPHDGEIADDTRPVMVVEFPGQHVFEQALFAPKPPPLPDQPLQEIAFAVHCVSGARPPEDEIDLPAKRPLAVEIIAEYLVFDPNSRPQVVDMLAMLKGSGARKTARDAIFRAKVKAWQTENPPPQGQPQVKGDFETLAEAYAPEARALVRRNKLPVDQTVYIGDFALEADAMAAARRVWAKRIAAMVTDAVSRTFDSLQEARDGLTAQAAKEVAAKGAAASTESQRLVDYKVSAENSLLMESRLEAAVPGYQLFRNFYREAQVRAYLDGLSCDGPSAPADAPEESSVAELEYFFSPDHVGNGSAIQRSWMPPRLSTERLKARAERLIARYAEEVLVNDLTKIIRDETQDGLVEGRLANPSRLAFRVPCPDGIDAARLGVVGLDHDDDARVSLPRAAIRFDLDALTNFSAFEMSVVRRAQVIYGADESGRTDPGSLRQQDLSPGGMLDHLGFASGDFVNAATRLGDVQNALRQPPGRLETAIEIPARLILSPNQDAVVLTPNKAPENLFDGPDRAPRKTCALWSARFVTDSIDPGLRAVHSPDLRPDFVWHRNHRKLGGAGGALPGGAAPPRGPMAPWFIERHQTDAPQVSPRQIAAPYGNIDSDVARLLQENAEDQAFCTAVVKSTEEDNRRLSLPHLVGHLCRSLLSRTKSDASCSGTGQIDRRFRGPTDAFMRHELVLLTSAWGLPVTGRRTPQGQLSAFSSQAEPEPRHQLMDVGPGAAIYMPRTLAVSELSLSALGGSLRHDTSFEPPAAAKGLRPVSGNPDPLFDALSIERWQQWTVLGRDIFCEVVFKGFLFPLGHRASLVQVTERSFLRDDTGAIRAYLRQRMFIRIGRPQKSYPGIAQPNGGREFPVDQLTLLTTQTPDIVDPSEAPSGPAPSDDIPVKVAANGRVQLGTPGLVFWPRTAPIDAANVRFDLDIDARVTDMPLIFVDNIAANDPETLRALVGYYNGLAHPDQDNAKTPLEPVRHLRTMTLGGEKWRYAPENKAGSASIETEQWTLKASGRDDGKPSEAVSGKTPNGGQAVDVVRFTNGNFDFDPVLQGADQPPFYPALAVARLRLRQAERMMGRSVPPVRASFDARFVETGFPALAPQLGTEADNPAANGGASEPKPEVVPMNASEVYLAFIDHPPQGMGEKGDQSGGVFRPSGLMVAASRAKGVLSFDRRLTVPPGNVNAAYADAFHYRPQPATVPAVAATPASTPAQPSAAPAPAPALEQSKLAEVTEEVRDIYKRLFQSDAKILGLVSIKDLMDVLEQLQDPKSGMPELAENIRYGAGQLQQATDSATDAAQSAVEFVRLRVVKPLSETVEDIREGWNAIEKRLIEQQNKVLSDQIVPFTFKEILPELDNALTGLDSALRESLAITDEIEFALSLGQIYEAGRRFLDAIKRTAANPADRIEAAFKERFQAVKSIFDALKGGLEEGLDVFVKEFAQAARDEIKARIITLILPKADGDDEGNQQSLSWAFKPVHLPLLADLSKKLPADAPQPEKLQELVNKALGAVYLNHREAVAVLDAFLDHLFDNKGSPNGFFEARTDLFSEESLVESAANLVLRPTHGEQIRALLEGRAENAVKILRDGAAALGGDVEAYLADEIAELELLLERLLQDAQEAAITYVVEEFSSELGWLLEVYEAAKGLQSALEARRINGILEKLLALIELFIGSTGLSSDVICAHIDQVFGWLNSFFGALKLDALKLAKSPENKTLCKLKNDGTIAPEHAPPGGEKDTLSGRLFALHQELNQTIEALADADLTKTVSEAISNLKGDKFKDIRAEATKYLLTLNTTAADVNRDLADMNRAVASMYCELRNDALAVDAMNQRLNTVFADVGCTSRPDEIIAKVENLPRELKTFADRRARMMRTLVEQLRIVAQRLENVLANETVQVLLGAGALFALLKDDIADISDDAKARIKALKGKLEKLRAREVRIAQGAASMLARASSVVKVVTGQLVDLAKEIEDVADDIEPYVAFAGINKNVQTIKTFDTYVDELTTQLKALAGDQKASFAKLKAISVDNGPPALTFFIVEVAPGVQVGQLEQEARDVRKRGLALLRDIQQQVEAEIKNLEGLARKTMRRVESEVLKELDGFAMQVLETDFRALVPVSKANEGADWTLFRLYEDVLLDERNDLHRRLNQPFFVPLKQNLLAKVPGNIPTKDGVWTQAQAAAPLSIENDALAAEVIWLRHIKEARAPLSDAASRDFLRYFFRSWGNKPTPLRIGEQLKDFVADIFKGDLLKAIDLNFIRQQVEEYLLDLIPDEIAMQYTYGVLLGEPVKEATLGIFAPADQTRLDITAKIVLHLNPNKPEVKFRSVGTLGAFDIKLVGDIFDALTLKFRGAEFITEAGQKPRFEIDYDDYEIGPELEFVQDLQSIMSPKEGSGAFILPKFSPPSVEAGYKLQLGMFSIGVVSFFNISLNTSALLPFTDEDARFRASLSTRDDPFTISYLPYGGSGFFAIEANTDGIVGFEAGFEFGGSAAFGFGPLTGEGRLMAGFYIRQVTVSGGRKLTEIQGTFFVGGSASIWIFSFGASLTVRLGMVNGDMSGEAIFTYSFSIGIKDFEFSVTVFKKEGKGFSGGPQAALDGPTRFASNGVFDPGARGQILNPRKTAVVQADVDCACDNWRGYKRYFDTPKDLEDLF